MREQKTATIDGTWYEIKQLGTRDQQRLIRLLTPVLELLAALAEVDKEGLKDGMALFAKAVSKLFRTFTDEELDQLFTLVCTDAIFEENGRKPSLSTPGVFDDHFSGRSITLYKYITFVVMANLSDFTEAWEKSPIKKTFQAARDNYRVLISQLAPLAEILSGPEFAQSLPGIISKFRDLVQTHPATSPSTPTT